MDRRKQLLIPIIIVLAGAAILLKQQGSTDKYQLVPMPKEIRSSAGFLHLTNVNKIVFDNDLAPAAELLSDTIAASTGLRMPLQPATADAPLAGQIALLKFKAGAAPRSASEEAYELEVTRYLTTIHATSAAGACQAVRTLLQLLPPKIFSKTIVSDVQWSMPCVIIRDEPRFAWRGYLLDVARHYFTPHEVRQMMSVAALHKLNRFQMHLTDDQGWRIEIKRFPKLTETGAWRPGIGFGLPANASTNYSSEGLYGGYYTQDDIRGLVRHAQSEQIMLVPEIELPGHATAALTAYPNLGCTGGPYTNEMHAGVFSGIFCPGNEETFAFIEGVLTEVMELFPGPYVHIGGDEVPKRNWRACVKCQERIRAEKLQDEEELQTWFVNRVEEFISSKGKIMVGWSEVFDPALSTNVVVMDWIGGGAEAARKGHPVVMSPTKYCYLDYYQSTNRTSEPRSVGGFIPLEMAYSFEPTPAGLAESQRDRILGAQGNLWTEYIANIEHAQYMTFPRLCALSEVFWSPATSRSYPEFHGRLKSHLPRLDAMGVRYRALDK